MVPMGLPSVDGDGGNVNRGPKKNDHMGCRGYRKTAGIRMLGGDSGEGPSLKKVLLGNASINFAARLKFEENYS